MNYYLYPYQVMCGYKLIYYPHCKQEEQTQNIRNNKTKNGNLNYYSFIKQHAVLEAE